MKHLLEPTPERIVRARKRAQLTQAEAAEIVHLGHGTRWSEYECATNKMPLATWELFLLKTHQRDLALN